jgi:mono/diheme cytochrome c family protein
LTYEKDILPIVQRACISCHGATRKRGGLDLRTFASLARGGESGVGVQPGKPDESALLESVVSGRMPPGKMKLPPAEKQLIRDWIASGAKSTKGR